MSTRSCRVSVTINLANNRKQKPGHKHVASKIRYSVTAFKRENYEPCPILISCLP
jgi:hypothetical protein